MDVRSLYALVRLISPFSSYFKLGGPHPHLSRYLKNKNGEFFLNKRPRVADSNSFLPIHSKTLNRWKCDSVPYSGYAV